MSPSWTLVELLELTLRHLKALNLPSALLTELQIIKEGEVFLNRRGGPAALSRTTGANLDCAFVENALDCVILKIARAGSTQ